MRTAIAATDNGPEAKVDSRFGRCRYFIICDDATGSVEYIPNPFRDAEESAGADAVKLLVSKGVTRIISGEFGHRIKTLLDSHKIQMIVPGTRERKTGEIIKQLLNK
jgi:predicted Fe-Mo cluster-binding NifX family protein